MTDREQTQAAPEKCGATNPLAKLLSCSKPKGHDGPHIAFGAGGTFGWGGMKLSEDRLQTYSSSEISAVVKAALARDPDADVLYVHDEDGQALAALIPIEVWRRELAKPEPQIAVPFEFYTHGHIAPEDDDA